MRCDITGIVKKNKNFILRLEFEKKLCRCVIRLLPNLACALINTYIDSHLSYLR